MSGLYISALYSADYLMAGFRDRYSLVRYA